MLLEMKPDQARVSALLKETIALMCKNGLTFSTKFSVDAVIGVTLDDKEAFYISMNELVRSDKVPPSPEPESEPEPETMSSSRPRKRKKHSEDFKRESPSDENESITTELPHPSKQEPADEDSDDNEAIVFVKEEPNTGSWIQNEQYDDKQPDQGHYSDQNTDQSQQGMSFPMLPGDVSQDSNLSAYHDSYNDSMLGLGGSQMMDQSGNMQGSPYASQSQGSSQGQGQVGGYCYCRICGKACTQKSYLKEHEKRHSGLFRYHCAICHKGFMSTRGLKGHMAKYHSTSEVNTNPRGSLGDRNIIDDGTDNYYDQN